MADTIQEHPAQNETPARIVDPAGHPVEKIEAPAQRKRRFLLVGVVVAIALVTGVLYYLHSQKYEDTDDAEVDAHLAPIAARVDGTVRAVYVEDNTHVKAGQPLVDLDPTDSEVALQQAQAKYDQAVAQQQAQTPNVPLTQISNSTNISTQNDEVVDAKAALAAAEHDYDSASATLRQAQANSAKSQADFARYKALYNQREVSRSDYDNYAAIAAAQAAAVEGDRAALASADKTVEQRKAQMGEQESKLTQNEHNAPHQLAIQQATLRAQAANVESLKANLLQAQLNVKYCHITAPVSGYTTQRSAEVGSRITSGQQLLMISETDDLWVTANFKETQLTRMQVGQRVTIHVDALKRDFNGTVDSMPAITGSRSSVLPPENATGNYVKVVQRMPMRIRFDKGQQDLDQLRPGMSVEPTVHLD
jgi:membrane fusion protein (multidrug efflux system)